MTIIHVLRESFHLLYKEPKVFIPRLITTIVYTLYLLYLAKITADITKILGYYPGYEVTPVNPEILIPFLDDIIFLLIFLFFLLALDLVSYAMYPGIIKDHYSKKNISLIKSLKEAFSIWKILLILGILITIFAVISSIFIFIFEFLTRETGNILFYLSSIFLVLITTLILLVLLFFVVPISVIEKKNLIETFQEGFKLSLKHKSELFAVNTLFLVLTIITFILVAATQIGFQGITVISAIILFILTRVIQAIVYTYICVVNPYFYVHSKNREIK